MKSSPALARSIAVIVLLTTTLLFAYGETDNEALSCTKSFGFFAGPDSPEFLKYPRDLEIRVLHLALDITPDFRHRTIEGKTTIRFKSNVKPAREIRFDAVDLRIHSVTSSDKLEGYQSTEDALIVTYAQPIPADREVTLTIEYDAEPAQGLYFRTPEMGYKTGDEHLFSQGESITARHWYPCIDSPNAMFTSEVTCRVPEGMTVISNGRLVSESRDDQSGLKVVHWSQEQPHANYLITLVAGYFKKVEESWRVPLAFFTPPSEIDEAQNSFRGTREMMDFFEKETGVPYPWPKYYQVCVNDFVAGGMENTSATTLTDGTLFTPATENIHSSEGLVAHELAHQWFGDLVTCQDWSQIWLNEGFATYYEVLWQGHRHGRDELLLELYRNARTILGAGGPPLSIVRRTYDDPDQMFGHLAYQKGGWVLHMLRSQLGEDMYRRCIKTYLERHQHGNVVTEDLRKVIEEFSGRSYDQFFNQWVYNAHYPELDASYSWDEVQKLARVSIRQVQRLDTNVLLFKFPLTIRFAGASGNADKQIEISKKEEDFWFPLGSTPKLVRIDPEYTVLAKINFSVPDPMLTVQLKEKSDMIGRLLAVEQYSKRRDRQAISQLREALTTDPYYAVRLEASRGLRGIHSEEAFDALLASTNQPDARVRLQVADDIGGFYDERAYSFERSQIDREKNPAIVSAIIRDLGGYSKPGMDGVLSNYLYSTSYRNELADAAIGAIRSQDDPAFIKPLLVALSTRDRDFTTGTFARGLSALAYLARNEDDKHEVREFLTSQLNSAKRTVRIAAINGLGTLGDPRAVGVVEKFATASKQSRERSAADAALTSLRASRKPVDDFKNLRQEVLDLQKTTRELRKQVDDLKKQLKDVTISTPEGKQSRKPKPLRTPKS